MSACSGEHEAAPGPAKATKETPTDGGKSKRAQYSQAPGAEKIDVNLLRLAQQVRRESLSLRQAAQDSGIVTAHGGIMLDIVTNDIHPGDKSKFQLPGVGMLHFSSKYDRVSVIVGDLGTLHKLAVLPEVRFIAPQYGAVTGGDSRK